MTKAKANRSRTPKDLYRQLYAAPEGVTAGTLALAASKKRAVEIRHRLEAATEALLALLDTLDGDADLEETCEDEGAQCEGEAEQCDDEGADQGDECSPLCGRRVDGLRAEHYASAYAGRTTAVWRT